MGGRADAAARAQVYSTCCGNVFRLVAASLACRQCLKAQSKHHAAELPFGCAACAPPPKLEIAPPVGVLFWKQAALARKLITQKCERAALGSGEGAQHRQCILWRAGAQLAGMKQWTPCATSVLSD